MKEKFKDLLKDIAIAILTIIITILFSNYVIGLTAVVGDSMNNTYQNGDLLLVKKYDKNPERFEVIIFNSMDTVLIKRVIGLPGDTVEIKNNGEIYINDKLIKENYGKEVLSDPGIASSKIKLVEDEYFVLGDNRNNSTDSRSPLVGVVKRSTIIGTLINSK